MKFRVTDEAYRKMLVPTPGELDETPGKLDETAREVDITRAELDDMLARFRSYQHGEFTRAADVIERLRAENAALRKLLAE